MIASLLEFIEAAAAVLHEECGMRDDRHALVQFERTVLGEDQQFGVEFRFEGALGHGGKFYLHSRHLDDPTYGCYVSCYPEDGTPERAAMIEKANARLRPLAAKLAAATAPSR